MVGNRNATHWHMERGYAAKVNESEVYPYRAFGNGLSNSLNVVLRISLDESHQFCSELAEGFRLALHPPDELPRLPDDFIHIPVDQDIYVSVKPRAIITSDKLRHYRPKKRGCYFKSERRLRFFKSYNQENCELECSANFTYKKCGCVKFAMPSELFIGNGTKTKKMKIFVFFILQTIHFLFGRS